MRAIGLLHRRARPLQHLQEIGTVEAQHAGDPGLRVAPLRGFHHAAQLRLPGLAERQRHHAVVGDPE
jgi:hypothetical protein